MSLSIDPRGNYAGPTVQFIYGLPLSFWIVFHLVLGALLAFDLGILQRKEHAPSLREAVIMSVIWIALGSLFGVYVWFHFGAPKGAEFFLGYVVEKSLSVDNLFVFLVIFKAFQIEPKHQHRILFWGILGAIFLRATMVALGTELITNFHWVLYGFGIFLVYTAVQLFRQGEKNLNPRETVTFRWLTRILPVSKEPHTGHFFPIEDGRRVASIGFIALLLIEVSDVVFAIDSIPAVFGVTKDPAIVYTSNICAILGLRALFFVLEDIMERFVLLKYALSIILGFVGVKMLIEDWVRIPHTLSLGVIFGTLVVSILLSLKLTKSKELSPP